MPSKDGWYVGTRDHSAHGWTSGALFDFVRSLGVPMNDSPDEGLTAGMPTHDEVLFF